MRVPKCQFIFRKILKMRNENFSSFSFLLKIENNFTIHFSFFCKNENKYFLISFFKFSKKVKMKRNHFWVFKKNGNFVFKFIVQFWNKKNENCHSFANSIFIASLMSLRERQPGDRNALITWCLLPLQTWLIRILPSTWSSSQEEREKEESKEN